MKLEMMGWYSANNTGKHRIILPGYRAIDDVISISTGITDEKDGKIPVEITMGADVRTVKIYTEEGAIAESVIAGYAEAIANGTMKTNHDDIKRTSKVRLSFDKTGEYTLVAVGLDANGKLINYAFDTFGYKKSAAEEPVELNYGLIRSNKYSPDGMTEENSLEIYINGKNIQRLHVGLFEKDIKEIATLVHECGGLLYYDGANMNPLIGMVRPGDMGFDVLHLNLHKSFSTPHGGGGPGAGPVGVAAHLVPYLPVPKVVEDEDGLLSVVDADGQACGHISGFMGNFGVLLRAYTYILMLGKQNVRMVGPLAVLGANYIKESLKDCYKLPIESVCKHEFVFDGLLDQSTGVTTLDIAKRLLDYGFHAPTIYFPLLFHQAIMIEPTETESKETLDGFIEIMRHIAAEAIADPESLKTAPHTTPVRRLDETTAARQPVLRYERQQLSN